MNRAISLLLAVVLVFSCLSGCAQKPSSSAYSGGSSVEEIDHIVSNNSTSDDNIDSQQYSSLSDKELLRCFEDQVYLDLIDSLPNDEFFIENIKAVYVSKEYLDELNYNSQSNVYFGYTLSELHDIFQNDSYVFTLGDNGETSVSLFEEYDDTYERSLQNIAIGTGVILLCVTVGSIANIAGAPAISAILLYSAKSGTEAAISFGTMSAVCSGIIEGIKSGNIEDALKAASLSGSESFKWGAIAGTVSGGVAEAVKLKGATLSGLTMNEAAAIQKESKYPLDLIKQFHSMEEYKVYQEAGLQAKKVNGQIALVQDIDLTYTSDLAGKTVTNLQRMQSGYAPIDPVTGKYYQLHHIGQKNDGALAILTEAQHQGNSAILNYIGGPSQIDRDGFSPIRKAFWKAFAALLVQGG